MLLRCVCLSLRISIDSAIVPVISPDDGKALLDGCSCGNIPLGSSIDPRRRATLGSLLQRCCTPHLVMHCHSYGPDKSFVPALSSPPVLVGAALPGWGCARGSMSLGRSTSCLQSSPFSYLLRCCEGAPPALSSPHSAGPNHALYSSRGTCYGSTPVHFFHMKYLTPSFSPSRLMHSHSLVPPQQRLRSNWPRLSFPPAALAPADTSAHALHSGASPPYSPLLQSSNLHQVACGECHSVALTSDGRVWTWGGSGFGQLGRGKGGKGGLAAVELHVADGCCLQIAAGAHHTVAVMTGFVARLRYL
jgi:hypothetical protein